MIPEWQIKGELILNCNCTVFCPCVISLGQHPPTEGTCHGWAGIDIQEGFWGDVRLDGLAAGMILDIPGKMAEGNWTAAAYIDDRSTPEQAEAVEKILTGQARGTTGLFKMLVSTYLGTKTVPMEFSRDGAVRRFSIPKVLEGAIEPVPGKDKEEDLVINNSQYWMGSDVTVSKALKGRFRDFGRVWNLEERSAELVRIDWSGP